MSSILKWFLKASPRAVSFTFWRYFINNAEKVTDFQCSENILIFESSKLSKEGMNQFYVLKVMLAF